MVTPRLVIRSISTDDAEFICRLLNEPDFIRFIGDRGVRNSVDARRYIINGPQKSYVTNGFGLWLICLAQTAEPVGMAGLIKRAGLEDIDIGYGFVKSARGQGYAFETAQAILNYARTELNQDKVVAIVSPDNISSIGLLNKLGFSFNRLVRLPGEDHDCQLFC
ncbi:GNAT family N-acetyltransferase [Neptunicella sp. SCSIO 80796]|uniref:GNAT family N-acetyltransferase n=1 Tax=Neptunicella plasticusilytica TaxID=3117012 RepID=UPI003A4E2424